MTVRAYLPNGGKSGRFGGMGMHLRLLAIVFSLLAVPGAADGLTLYRYVDPDGRVVIVGSLDKVPEECRKTLRIETIGKRREPEVAEASPHAARLEDASQDAVATASELPGTSNAAATASETEMPDEEHASATLWLTEMQEMLRRNDEIWHVANTFTPYHRRILVLQEENLRAVDRVRSLETMTWKDHDDWLERARGVNDQLRQLAFTITLWLRQSPEQLRRELAPLVNRIHMVLDLLAQSLPRTRKRQ